MDAQNYKAHLEENAQAWVNAEKSEPLLFKDWKLALATEWCSRYAERHGGISTIAEEFLREGVRVAGSANVDELSSRIQCKWGGETYLNGGKELPLEMSESLFVMTYIAAFTLF
jgi:hypothetical protein